MKKETDQHLTTYDTTLRKTECVDFARKDISLFPVDINLRDSRRHVVEIVSRTLLSLTLQHY